MRSYETFDLTDTQPVSKPFAIETKALDRSVQIKMAAVFILALLTVLMVGIFTLHPSNASQADKLTNLATQGLTSTKSDRMPGAVVGKSCESQAWGAWSEDCAAALTGASKVRNVSFVTVEKSSPTVNETILARYPVTN